MKWTMRIAAVFARHSRFRGNDDSNGRRRSGVQLATALLSLLSCTALSARELRVCADPNNLPYSNAAGQGFENRIIAVLAKDLGQEYFRYDEAAKLLIGDETRETYRIGQRLTLRLAEANPVSGSLRFELPEGSYGGASAPVRRDRTRGRRGRPPNIRHQSRRR